MRKIIAIAALASLTSACATKNFGTMEPITNIAAYNCPALTAELERVDHFLATVEERSRFNAASALGAAVDFGIGNKRAKAAAIRTANARKVEIVSAMDRAGCPW